MFINKVDLVFVTFNHNIYIEIEAILQSSQKLIKKARKTL